MVYNMESINHIWSENGWLEQKQEASNRFNQHTVLIFRLHIYGKNGYFATVSNQHRKWN